MADADECPAPCDCYEDDFCVCEPDEVCECECGCEYCDKCGEYHQPEAMNDSR